MPDAENDKLPQNIQHLLMEIGEKAVLFRLLLMVRDNDWEVYQNFGHTGCDLILVNSKTNDKIKMEVKTRQRLFTTSINNKNIVHFTITENEYKNSDFVIAFWFEENHYFVVPKESLAETSSNEKVLYKFIVRKKVDGSLNKSGSMFLNNWKLLEERMGISS